MDSQEDERKWAPWWIYVVVIVGCNILKQQLVEDYPVALNAVITVALAGVLFVLITVIYRTICGSPRRQR